MKHKKLIKIVTKEFKNVNVSYKEAIKNYEPEGIHAFRVEVKKLRAFLRLAKDGMGHGRKIKLPKKIKQFYSAVGDIRILQLQKEHIVSSLADRNKMQLKNYFNELNIATETAVKYARQISQNNKSFEKKEKKIINILRKRHAKINKKNFFLSASHKLQCLLAKDHEDDESLHLYRKLAKDIMYTWSWIKKKEIDTLPIPFTNYNRIKFLSDLLGEFHDTTIDLNVLENQETKIQLGNDESKILSDIQNEWAAKKENIGHKLHDRLVIELVPLI